MPWPGCVPLSQHWQGRMWGRLRTARHCYQHGQEMLSTHCPVGPPGDPQVWPPQDKHSSLAWHQPIAPAATELWQSTARGRVSPWMTIGNPVGAASQTQGWQGWSLWGAQGAPPNAIHSGTADPCLHSLLCTPIPSPFIPSSLCPSAWHVPSLPPPSQQLPFPNLG